jgi:putative ABC transport system substrate-binding protein
MRRRAFIAGLAGAAAMPRVLRAQQANPVVGYLHAGSAAPFAALTAAARRGLAEGGFVEGRNLTIEYRWAEGQPDRLGALAADLVQRRVALIVAGGGNLASLAAKSATSTIPVVFTGSDDAVKFGLVASLNKPGGNVTGAGLFNATLAAKRLEVARALAPDVTSIALLVNPRNPNADIQIEQAREAAGATKLTVHVLHAGTEREIEAAFAALAERRIRVLMVGADPLYLNRRTLFTLLAVRHLITAIYTQREFSDSGGLISYGPSFAENYRQAGVYAARILKGAKPADLPVIQPSKFELVLNQMAAKALGLTIPSTLLALADEVIE